MIANDLLKTGTRKYTVKPFKRKSVKAKTAQPTCSFNKEEEIGPKMPKIVWSIFWLIILIIFSFWVATFLAFFYIILYPITVCIPDISAITDFLLKCIQFPKYCAENMMAGTALF